jgi:His-Xaa-Ser system radical SAM maturase HxsC
MRSYKLLVKNIDKFIIGKVIAVAYTESGSPNGFIFVYNENNIGKSGLITCVENSFQIDVKNPIIFTDNINFFNPGDIFLLEPSGVCILLYESNSFSNALLITENCNSNCILCPQPPIYSHENYLNQSLQVISLLDEDTQVLGITGGEPTIVWDDLIKILIECKNKIPQAFIQLLTNGRLLSQKGKVQELKEANSSLLVCIPIYSDIDSIHDYIVSSKGAFWETVNGLYNLAYEKVAIELRTVITKLNYRRLPQFAEFIYKNFPFAQHIALMALEPIGLAFKNIEELWIDPYDYIQQLDKAVKILHRRNCNVSIYNHQLCTLSGFAKAFSKKSISEWKIRYKEICTSCKEISNCGGLFESASSFYSRALTPF